MSAFILPILLGAVGSMILGSLWFGPLFGKKWMEVCGVSEMDKERRKQMQKEAGPLYLIQFLLVILQLYIFSYFSNGIPVGWSIENALLIWLAFVMPTVAGSAMWNNDSNRIKWARFGIQSGYQFVLFLMFGLIFGLLA